VDELPDHRGAAEQDSDAPLARDAFARILGDGWQREEPGIYRFVGPTSSGSESRLERKHLEHNGLEHNGVESHPTQRPGRSWTPWRKH
jgi:hypothetical protein